MTGRVTGLRVTAEMRRADDPAAWTAEAVRERLEEMAATLRAYRVAVGPAGYRSYWPTIVRSAWESYLDPDGKPQEARLRRPAPSGRAIDRMDQAIAWFALLDARDRKLVWAWANGAAWWRLADRWGRNERTLRRWLDGALAVIVGALNEGQEEITRSGAKRMSTMSGF